ncbi:MAG: type II toxin-antitoxin system HigB family toxin [Desulfomonile sp.]
MRIISKRQLREFWEKHPDAKQPLFVWYSVVKKADWREPIDITSTYRNARTIGMNRAIFSLKGNDYRLVVAIRYDKGIVFIRFVGTHDQYNKIDALTI